MLERFQPTLALLDQGLSVYRRHFLSFVLVAAIWFVPVAVLVGLGVALGERLSEGFVVLLALLGAVLLFVLMVYVVAALSRVAAAVLDGQPMRLRDTLSIGPLRLFAMSVFTVVYFVVAQIATSLVSMVCICPAYIFGIALVGGAAAVGGEAAGVGSMIVFVLIFAAIYVFSLFIGGATYSGMVYGLQPWAQEQAGFGTSLQQSIDLMVYRFWRNIAVWGFAALILSGVGVTIGTLAAAGPGFLLAFFGWEEIGLQALTVSVWLVALVLLLPPLPIWMALLYRQNRQSREGADLQAKISAWQAANVPTTGAGF